MHHSMRHFMLLCSSSTDRPCVNRYYWTLRFMLYDAETDFAAGTRMSQEAFYPEIYTFANTNNFGGRFFYPGRFDNESLLAFE